MIFWMILRLGKQEKEKSTLDCPLNVCHYEQSVTLAVLLVFFCKFLLIQLAFTFWQAHREDWG